MKFIKFDENLNIKDKDEDLDKCYNFFDIANYQCYTIQNSYLLYIKNDNEYFMFRCCNVNGAYQLILLSILETCNTKIENEISGFNIGKEIIDTTFPLPLPTTLLESSTIPIPLTTLLEKESTTLTSIPYLNLISTLIQTTIISTSQLASPTTIPELSTTSIAESSTIPELEATSNIITDSPSTLVNYPLTSNLFSSDLVSSTFPNLFHSTIILPSTSPLFQTTQLSSLVSTIFIQRGTTMYNSYIEYYMEGDIMKGKINKTKEEIENDLDEIIKTISIIKKY